jgi:hypothetical protein
MTLLIQKSVADEAARQRIIRTLERNGWSVNLENTDDDADFDKLYDRESLDNE